MNNSLIFHMSGVIPLLLAIFLAFSLSASAQEVAYAYGESGGRSLESGNVSQYNGSDIVNFTVSSSTPGEISYISNRSLESIKEEISRKINRGNELVRDQGLDLIGPISGPRQIDQICAIYDYLVDKRNWSYVSDWTGLENFQYSNYTLKKGKDVGHLGIGDCDDFAILLGALIESVGASPRIVFAYGPNGGHAYAQVYLGKAEDSGDRVNRTMRWLRNKYHVEDIICHRDLSNGDVWLNLDWWKEPGGANHPGGPFFTAINHIPIYMGEPLNPVNPVNEPPLADFSIFPELPNAGETTTLNASMSRDTGGEIVFYEWDFGDGNKTGKMSDPMTSHSYFKGGLFTVILTLVDDEDATNSSSREIIINNPPQANFTNLPLNPVVHDQVKFDASESYDVEDGKSLAYHWDINNNSATLKEVSPPKQVYDDPGMYWINLTVTDKNGAKGHKNKLLKINQLPIPRINFDISSLTLGMTTNFSAAASEDLDGEIVSYAWNFGDNSEIDHNITAMHIYHDGGEKIVRLTVEDNNGSKSNTSRAIMINRPPIASFNIDPEQPKKGETISFNASASYDPDPDAKIKRYLWDFGIGKAEPDVYNTELVEYAYNRIQSYNVTLTVEDDKGATDSFSRLIEVTEINRKPILTSLQSDIESPLKIGNAVKWKAVANDAESDPLEFQFLLNGTVVQDWSSSPAWSWNADQVGLHVIEAKVRDGKHDSNGDSSNIATFEIVPPLTDAPVMIALLPNKESPQVTGTAIVWTAEAFDSDNDPLEFQFLLDGAIVQDWTSSSAWSWNADQAGEHWIMVQVRDGDHDLNGDSSKSSSFELVTPPNDTPVMSELSSDKQSPQVTGTAIAWTASASDSEYDPLEFQFLLDGAVVQDWSSSPVWNWNADQVGSHVIAAKVRDGKHDANGDSFKSAAFEIIVQPSNYAPVLIELSPDKPTPQETGTAITWTAIAIDTENDPLEFQFSLDGKVVQYWSWNPVWIWNVSRDQAGSHVIEAMVRDGKHSPEGIDTFRASFEIARPFNATNNITINDYIIPNATNNTEKIYIIKNISSDNSEIGDIIGEIAGYAIMSDVIVESIKESVRQKL
ncbi:MAG: PKD domain-containing protein [Methanothrix sp.]